MTAAVHADTGEIVEITGTHPVAELFPMLDDEDMQALSDDIAANGLAQAVVLDRDGQLLDGRNRLRACELAGVAARTKVYDGDDPISFSISLNMKRRHLTTGQKAAVACASLPLYEAEAERHRRAAISASRGSETAANRQPSEPTLAPKASRESTARAAANTGTSGRSVARFKRVAEEAPDLVDKVKDGSVSLDRADRIVRDRQSQERKIVEARAEANAVEEKTTVDIRHGPFLDVLADLVNVDAVITDPPYSREFLPLLADLAAWSDKVLSEDGVLAVLIGQTHLPEVYRLLDGHRPYRWTAAYLTPGAGYVSHPRKIQSNWKPLVVFGGGRRFSDTFTTAASDADAKSHHRWGQDYGAFHEIVKRLTSPGQTVVDPFMGSGTTLLAAKALGRHAVGCDVDAESVATAEGRLS